MFTDMVGYSALTQANEAQALRLLEQHFRLVRSTIRGYRGREIKTIGDAFLIEFDSALAALDCAIAVQQQHAARNEAVAPADRFEIRIGIHLGDVEHRGVDVFGDGVNVAARVEPLAPPGGIAVTGHVHAQVHSELLQRFVALGPQPLKNISVPVDVFVLDASAVADLGRERSAAEARPRASRFRWPLAAAAAGVALATAAILWRGAGPDAPLPRGEEPTPPPAATPPAPAASYETASPWPKSGETIRDCAECPEMVPLPGGTFLMGSTSGPAAEGPAHRVTVPPLLIGKYEVTFAEWDACAAAGGCSYRPDDDNWGRGSRPAIRVSWNDAQEYVRWLSKRAGRPYRLPTESEWEYAARAGTTTPYHWGDAIGSNNAVCAGCRSRWDKRQTAPVGSLRPNAFGLHDMLGNVLEWVQDCHHDTYDGAPSDASAWTAGTCQERVQRGGSWDDEPVELRTAHRDASAPADRDSDGGFRVARNQ